MTGVEESWLKVWAELGRQAGSPQPGRDLGSRGRHASEHRREAVIVSGMAPPQKKPEGTEQGETRTPGGVGGGVVS